MKILNVIKYFLILTSLVFIFLDWRIAIGLFLISTILQVIPLGPNALLSVITGYLIIGGGIYLFINWRIGIGLIIGGALVAKFRIYGNKANAKYHAKHKKKKI